MLEYMLHLQLLSFENPVYNITPAEEVPGESSTDDVIPCGTRTEGGQWRKSCVCTRTVKLVLLATALLTVTLLVITLVVGISSKSACSPGKVSPLVS